MAATEHANTASEKLKISGQLGKVGWLGQAKKMRPIEIRQFNQQTLICRTTRKLKINQKVRLNLVCSVHRLYAIPAIVIQSNEQYSEIDSHSYAVKFDLDSLADDARSLVNKLLMTIEEQLSNPLKQ